MKTLLGGAFEIHGLDAGPYCETGIHAAGQGRVEREHLFDWHASGARCVRCGLAYTDFTAIGSWFCDWVSSEGRARAQEPKEEVGATGLRCPHCTRLLRGKWSAPHCEHCGRLLPQSLWNR